MTASHPSTLQDEARTRAPGPTLVFVHGFLDGAAVWDEVVDGLGERAADALCVDLPGMGLRVAESELAAQNEFAHVVVNDRLEDAAEQLVAIVASSLQGPVKSA